MNQLVCVDFNSNFELVEIIIKQLSKLKFKVDKTNNHIKLFFKNDFLKRDFDLKLKGKNVGKIYSIPSEKQDINKLSNFNQELFNYFGQRFIDDFENIYYKVEPIDLPQLKLTKEDIIYLINKHKNIDAPNVDNKLYNITDWKGETLTINHPIHGTTSNTPGFSITMKGKDYGFWMCQSGNCKQNIEPANKNLFTLYGVLTGVINCKDTYEITPTQIKEIYSHIIKSPYKSKLVIKTSDVYKLRDIKDLFVHLFDEINFNKGLDEHMSILAEEDKKYENYRPKIFYPSYFDNFINSLNDISIDDGEKLIKHLILIKFKFGNVKIKKYHKDYKDKNYIDMLDYFINRYLPFFYNKYYELYDKISLDFDKGNDILYDYEFLIELFDKFKCEHLSNYIKKQIQKQQSKIKIVDAVSFCEKKEPIKHYCQGFITENSTTMVFSPPKSMKTFTLLDYAIRQSLGIPFLGIPCRKINVLYIDWENGKQILQDRIGGIINQINQEYNKKLKPSDLPMYVIEKPPRLVYNEYKEAKIDSKLIDTLIERCLHFNTKVVVFDTFVRMGTFDDSSNSHVSEIKQMIFDRLLNHGISSIFLHHTGKVDAEKRKNGQGGKKQHDRSKVSSFRGASDIEGGLSASYELIYTENETKLTFLRSVSRLPLRGKITGKIEIQNKYSLDDFNIQQTECDFVNLRPLTEEEIEEEIKDSKSDDEFDNFEELIEYLQKSSINEKTQSEFFEHVESYFNSINYNKFNRNNRNHCKMIENTLIQLGFLQKSGSTRALKYTIKNEK